jgi:hypothetical protein
VPPTARLFSPLTPRRSVSPSTPTWPRPVLSPWDAPLPEASTFLSCALCQHKTYRFFAERAPSHAQRKGTHWGMGEVSMAGYSMTGARSAPPSTLHRPLYLSSGLSLFRCLTAVVLLLAFRQRDFYLGLAARAEIDAEWD